MGLLRWGLLLVAVVLVVGLGGLGWLAFGSLPSYRGEVAVTGLDAPVRIVRDAHAIPHIMAGSPRDAYFGLGYVHAQDRLWQLEMHRRIGQGRLAEVLGPAALPVDRFIRTLGLYRLAQASESHLSAQAMSYLQAYADGINAFVRTSRKPLPPEFQILRTGFAPWTVADSLVFLRLMAVDLTSHWREELLRARLARRLSPEQLGDLWPATPPDTPTTLAAYRRALHGLPLDRLAALVPPPVLAGIGSNIFVLSGDRTASGAPILASDPHLALQAPGIWYLAHLEAPGLSAIGGTMAAAPIIIIGRNRDVAWGLTTTEGATQDLFIERVDPKDPGRYLTPDGTAPFIERREEIAVRGQAPVPLRIRATRHGPVISDLVGSVDGSSGEVLALAWPALREDDVTVESGFDLAVARNAEEARQALRHLAAPEQNVGFADRFGHTGFLAAGLVPIRKKGDGRLPVPGWTGEYDWTGFIPFDQLPQAMDPPSGLFINANNRVVGPDYPYTIAVDWPPALRARRLEELLGDAKGVTLDRARAVQLDIVSTLAKDFLPFLLAVKPADADERAILDGLGHWDRVTSAERWEPLVFIAWYDALAPRIYADELGPLFDAYRGMRPDFLYRVLTRRQVWCDDVATPEVETCPEQVERAFRDAVGMLRERYGDDWRQWRWGAAHPAVMAHRPFHSVRPLRRLFDIVREVGGDGSTVDVAPPGAVDPRWPFATSHGPGLRVLVDMSRPDSALFVAATGESGHPLSRHYADLTRLWREGRYASMSMAESDFERGALGDLRLVPEARRGADRP